MPSHPWERLADEPAGAYAAFLIYRDLGPDRTLDRAWQSQQEGNRKATGRAGGTWNGWCSYFRWVSRSTAWDDRLRAAADRGVVQATEAEGSKWRRARLAQLDRDFALAQVLIAKAELILKFPVSETTVEADGRTTVVMPLPLKDLKIASAVLALGQRMAWATLERAVPPEEPDQLDTRAALIAALALVANRKGRPAPSNEPPPEPIGLDDDLD